MIISCKFCKGVKVMVYDMNFCVAVKDDSGKYNTMDFSMFNLDKANDFFENMQVEIEGNRQACIKVRCPYCGEEHSYSYSFEELLNREILVGGCESIGVPLFFVGKHAKVMRRVFKYNEVNNKFYAMMQ